jgi:hypothetical protein
MVLSLTEIKLPICEVTHEAKDQVWGICAKHRAAVHGAGARERQV